MTTQIQEIHRFAAAAHQELARMSDGLAGLAKEQAASSEREAKERGIVASGLDALREAFNSLNIYALIDDSETSEKGTWSSAYIAGFVKEEIGRLSGVDNAVWETIERVKAALDTAQKSDGDTFAKIISSLSGAVRWDARMDLKPEHQKQARENINAASADDLYQHQQAVGDLKNIDFTKTFMTGLVPA